MYRYVRSDIYRDENGNLDIDYYNQNHGGLTTRLGKNNAGEPYLTSNDQLLNGHEVYSVYAFTGDDYVDIFKEIKKGGMDKALYSEWLDYTARYIWENILSKNKPDIIAVPESSSNLVENLAGYISKISRIDYLPHAFKKNPVDDIVLSIPDNVRIPEKSMQKLEQILEKFKKNGRFEAKAVPKRMLKFFRNIYTNDDDYVELLQGKKIAVLDDSMTSKITMANIFDVCDYLYEASESYGVTIFKKTSSRK